MLAGPPSQTIPPDLSARVQFGPAGRSDAPALTSFLQQVFRLPPTATFLDERHVAWKYWSDRADWNGPRSFTARHGDTIVAHVAAWPVRFRWPDRVIPAAHLIDWASDPKYPGAGRWLIRQMAKTRLLIATGGTAITRRMLPVLGFRPFGEVCCFARPLRPFSQAWTTTAEKTWRLPARFVRNSLWRFSPASSALAGWTAAPIAPNDVDERVWPVSSPSMSVADRGADFYRYVLASPSTRHALFGLWRHGEPIGYFCIAYARHVARIADLWVASPAVEDWGAGFRCAAAAAARRGDMYEVTAWTSTALGREALVAAGFRLRDCSALSGFGDTTALAGRDLHIQMLDCDASFLAADEVSYLT